MLKALFERKTLADTVELVNDATASLFTHVWQTLMSAAYDVSANDSTRGLIVTQDGNDVVIQWTATHELMILSMLHAQRASPVLPGMRDAVYTALMIVLSDAGFTATTTDDPNALRVIGPNHAQS